mgnify:CR=1 FL=1
MRFPIQCFDDFYLDPKKVRQYALDLPYDTKGGVYPGLRTTELREYDENFHYVSVHKFLSMCDDFALPEVEIGVETYFQKIWRFSKDKDDPINLGWVHADTNTVLAGLVYLSPDPDPAAGTTIYNLKKDAKIPEWMVKDPNVPDKSKCFREVLASEIACPIDSIKDYSRMIVDNNNLFEPTVVIKNKYNRMIAYDGDQHHGMTTCWMDNDEDFRLTQVFFVKNITCSEGKFPNWRCKRYGI